MYIPRQVTVNPAGMVKYAIGADKAPFVKGVGGFKSNQPLFYGNDRSPNMPGRMPSAPTNNQYPFLSQSYTYAPRENSTIKIILSG